MTISEHPTVSSAETALEVRRLIRSSLRQCLERITRSSSPADSDLAICDLYDACLPAVLRQYLWLFPDLPSLSEGVKHGVPIALSHGIRSYLRYPVFIDLYEPHVRERVRRAAGLVLRQVDRVTGKFFPHAHTEPELHEVRLTVWLADVLRDFAGAVLIEGPAPPKTTQEERAVARQRRLNDFIAIRAAQRVEVNLQTIAGLADVPRTGNRSIADWLNGRLPDSAAASRRIEAVLQFRKPEPKKKIFCTH